MLTIYAPILVYDISHVLKVIPGTEGTGERACRTVLQRAPPPADTGRGWRVEGGGWRVEGGGGGGWRIWMELSEHESAMDRVKSRDPG